MYGNILGRGDEGERFGDGKKQRILHQSLLGQVKIKNLKVLTTVDNLLPVSVMCRSEAHTLTERQ